MERVWLKDIRLKKGFNQKEISDLVNITQQCYGYYESGKRTPKPPIAKKIATILGFNWIKFFD